MPSFKKVVKSIWKLIKKWLSRNRGDAQKKFVSLKLLVFFKVNVMIILNKLHLDQNNKKANV